MSTIITSIIEQARRNGLTQGELARRAGVHPVSLSRAAKSGRCTLELVEKIAAVVGQRLVCVPDTPLAEQLARGEVF